MTHSNPSASYFKRVAAQWDNLRKGYFGEALRATAISKAYLRTDMVVADVGAGTGYMAAALAPLVKRVYALDGSPAMLEVARQNLGQFSNVFFEPADGLALPLPEDSLDVVFANMYLHHCPDPLAAICEMVRILRPGGRLVITDLDIHSYAWLKDEMADIWQGFERDQVRAWFREAGLVNRIVDCTGQSCCAESQSADLENKSEREAKISIFVAVGTKQVPGITEAVQTDYSALAEGKTSCCCSMSEPDSCCGSQAQAPHAFQIGYMQDELVQVPGEAADISLGCGNPVAIASLQPGDTVLDIGSGGGLDAFLAAQKVGETGKVIGVDMTPAMLERARRSAEKAGYSQVEFRQGHAESLPVENGSIDVIISNCVVNLAQDKGQVFSEAYRVLKGGGRLEVSDVITDGSLPGDLRENPAGWPGCVAGALPEAEYVDLIKQAGFDSVRVRKGSPSGEIGGTHLFSALISAQKGKQ